MEIDGTVGNLIQGEVWTFWSSQAICLIVYDVQMDTFTSENLNAELICLTHHKFDYLKHRL
jgi:hypothetical protein